MSLREFRQIWACGVSKSRCHGTYVLYVTSQSHHASRFQSESDFGIPCTLHQLQSPHIYFSVVRGRGWSRPQQLLSSQSCAHPHLHLHLHPPMTSPLIVIRIIPQRHNYTEFSIFQSHSALQGGAHLVPPDRRLFEIIIPPTPIITSFDGGRLHESSASPASDLLKHLLSAVFLINLWPQQGNILAISSANSKCDDPPPCVRSSCSQRQ